MITAHPMVKGGFFSRPTVKPCTKCKEVKPLTEFRADTRYKLGVSSRCKKCCCRSKRSKEPSAVKSPEELIAEKKDIRATKKLAIAINEYLMKNAPTQEARRNFYHVVNNLQGAR